MFEELRISVVGLDGELSVHGGALLLKRFGSEATETWPHFFTANLRVAPNCTVKCGRILTILTGAATSAQNNLVRCLLFKRLRVRKNVEASESDPEA